MTDTIEQILQNYAAGMTLSERRIADVISRNYPVSGLGNITALALRAEVSAPTVARFVQKLGFEKYADFQQTLRNELDLRLSDSTGPVNPWSPNVPEAHMLNRITEAVATNVRQSLEDIDVDEFENVCALLCDHSRQLFIIGGRVTTSVGDHMYQFMQVIRPRVQFVNKSHVNVFYSLLDMHPDDVVLVYDIRRYENTVHDLAGKAKELGVRVILITDQWGSPLTEIADHTIKARIAMPTGRDSMVSLMLINEIMIAQIHHELGDFARERIGSLEQVFKGLRFFRDN